MYGVLLLTSALASPPPSATVAGCPPLPDHPPMACGATGNGWFYATTAEAAAAAAGDGAAAAAAFQRYFGQIAPVGATVLSSHFPKAAQAAFREQHDLPYLRSWLPTGAKLALLEASLRRSQPDLPEERLQQVLQRAGRSSGEILRHELGHSLYQAVFWPSAEALDSSHYGTAAPDWLDEAAAILMAAPAP